MANPTTPIPKNVDGEQPITPITPGGTAPTGAGFEAKMGQPSSAQFAQSATGATGPTPMDLANPASVQKGTPTFDSLLGQSRTAQDGLGTVSQQLNYPNLKLNRPQTHLLKRHLQDNNEHLSKVAGQLGVNTPPMEVGSSSNTIARFLTWVGHGQDTLTSVQDKLQEISKKPDSLNPADMMLVQVKMNQAQNEIQYSTMLLSKVIDSLKQILQTQL